MPDVLTVPEVAELLRIGRRQCYELVRSGQIPGVIRLGRSIRISSSAVEAWLHNGAAEGGSTDEEPLGASPSLTRGGETQWKPPES